MRKFQFFGAIGLNSLKVKRMNIILFFFLSNLKLHTKFSLPPFHPLPATSPYPTTHLLLREREASHVESAKSVTSIEARPRRSPPVSKRASYPSIENRHQRANSCIRVKAWTHSQWSHKQSKPHIRHPHSEGLV